MLFQYVWFMPVSYTHLELEVLRGHAEPDGDSHAGSVDDGTDDDAGGDAQQSYLAEQAGADDDTCQSDDHRSRSHRGIEKSLVLCEKTAAHGYQRIGDSQSDDFYLALVHSLGGDDGFVIADSAEHESRLGGEIPVQQIF